MQDWETVIGLEVHVQLWTRSKMFCACQNAYGEAPNSLTCPVCLGLPGALPVLNGRAVQMAIAFGLAVQAQIRTTSTFYRKHYFYPDLPKGYQITQGPVAIVEAGWVSIPGDPAVRGDRSPIRARIERAHLEEDSGKLSHDVALNASLVDLNRAGVPLLEIVGCPDLRSPQEASDYLKVLHRLVVFLGICDGNMETGAFRCDANVSVRKKGAPSFGTRVEIKNLNSFRFVRQALEHEVARQISILEGGGRVSQETRGWDAASGKTCGQRTKEEAMDYRYFPEPDLPPLTVSPEEIQTIRASLPELPEQRKARFMAAHGLGEDEADTLLQSREFADYFETLAGLAPGKQAANWMLGELSRVLNERGVTIDKLGLAVEDLAGLIRLVEDRAINLNTAKEQVLPAMLAGEGCPEDIVAAKGLALVQDHGAIEALVRQVLADHPEQLAQWKAGRENIRGFLVGQIMKAAQGKADPRLVNTVLDKYLEESRHGD